MDCLLSTCAAYDGFFASAARVALFRGTRDSSSDALSALNWRDVPERISDKIVTTVCRLLAGGGPNYLAEHVTLYVPDQRLRSAKLDLLVPYRPQRKVGKRGLRFAVAKVWNGLSLDRRRQLLPNLF